jgi:hypothetical protein
MAKKQLQRNADVTVDKRLARQVRIYDNGGKTFDRYTAVYMAERERNGLYGARGMSESPFHPQGFGQCCTATPGRHLGRRIAFVDLPADCQRLVRRDLSASL